MDKFYLEKVSINKKNEILDFLNEFAKYNSDINGASHLYKIFKGCSFEDALEETLNMENEEYISSNSKCNSKTLLLIRLSDKRIVGIINIRWNLKEEMNLFGGNIGYSIRPTERRKGYNKINLYLGLIEAKKLGLDKVMLDCEFDNVGSYKTMEALGGILDREEVDPSDGLLTKVYIFNVNECINKYKNIYNDYIYNCENNYS